MVARERESLIAAVLATSTVREHAEDAHRATVLAARLGGIPPEELARLLDMSTATFYRRYGRGVRERRTAPRNSD